jgi:hypothetical protein
VANESTQAVNPVVRFSGVLRALLISGFLLALPGGLLPLWGYHWRPNFGTAGNYFLALGVGMATTMLATRRLARRLRSDRLLTIGCVSASVAILMLTLAAPPAMVWYQMIAWLVTGAAAGTINGAVFESIGTAWETDAVGVTLRGGIFFGAGSAGASLLVAQCFGSAVMGDAPVISNAPRLLALSALLPVAAAIAFRRLPVATGDSAPDMNAPTKRERRTVLATLFEILLFIQFANEWLIAGWLPVYLIDRLGMSPAGAVMLLAMYWMALTAGRTVAVSLLKSISRPRLLGISAFCALFGGTALTASDTRGGVVVGILLLGAGFSAIYPVASERITARFTGFDANYFTGLFTFAISGGILAAFAAGYLATILGLRVIPLAAMLGSCAVFALTLVIRLGSRVSGD